MEFQFSSISQVILAFALMGFGWVFRRCWRRYEKALVKAEAARRQVVETELREIRAVVSLFRKELDRLEHDYMRDHAALKEYLTKWARELNGNFSEQLKINQQDVAELREALNALASFFAQAKNNEKSSGIMVGKDMILIHRKERE